MNAPDLPVFNRQSFVVAWTKVDFEDFDWLCQWTWSLSSHGYVRRIYYVEGRQHQVYLHQEVMNFPGMLIDHFNTNKLDNRKSNLRPTNKSINRQNTSVVRIDSATQLKGVYFDKRFGTFYAYSKIAGKKIHLGSFKNSSDAVKVVKEFRKKLSISKVAV